MVLVFVVGFFCYWFGCGGVVVVVMMNNRDMPNDS